MNVSNSAALAIMMLVLPGIAEQVAAADPKPSKAPTVTTSSVTTLGIDGMTVNGSIHPHGVATAYYFEYGPTVTYGSKTASRPLPPRLAAFYRETWDENTGGWDSWSKGGLAHFPKGGAKGGFIRYSEPTRHDHNHDNGIGTVHLTPYLYPGVWGTLTRHATPYLGGGSPDLRDARVSVYVRGRDWKANGLKEPDEVKIAAEQLREVEDWLGRFLEEHVEKTANQWEFVSNERMFQRVDKWAWDTKEVKNLNTKKFAAEMKKRGHESKPVREGGKIVRVWIGLKLKDVAYQPSQPPSFNPPPFKPEEVV